MKEVKKTWGKEVWIENNEKYCGKMLYVEKNKWSSQGKYHYHKNKDETFSVLKGTLILIISGKEHILRQGETIRIEPYILHKFTAATKVCKFLEISTHHEDTDSYYDIQEDKQ